MCGKPYPGFESLTLRHFAARNGGAAKRRERSDGAGIAEHASVTAIPDSPPYDGSSATIPPVETPFLRRLVFVSVALVLVFAVVFTWGDALGMWPEAPSPLFRNADLAAGFLLIAALAFAAFRPRKRGGPRLAPDRVPEISGDVGTQLAGFAGSRPKHSASPGALRGATKSRAIAARDDLRRGSGSAGEGGGGGAVEPLAGEPHEAPRAPGSPSPLPRRAGVR